MEVTMTTAKDVVAYMERRLPDATELKLCKLAYYAQAWNLAWSGRVLFHDRIEAWKNGPVPADCWRERRYSVGPAPNELTAEARAVIDAVLEQYGQLTAAQLWALSHDEAPWREARGGLPESANSNAEITVGSMRRFYTRLSMRSKNVPKKPALVPVTSTPSALELAEREAKRWPGTLERLAHR